jgi:hypothetical protein
MSNQDLDRSKGMLPHRMHVGKFIAALVHKQALTLA